MATRVIEWPDDDWSGEESSDDDATSYFTASGVAWLTSDPFETIYYSDGDVQSVSAGMNNAWWGAVGGGHTYAAVAYYDTASATGIVRVATRPAAASSATEWLTTVEFTSQPCAVNGTSVVGFPCIAARSLPSPWAAGHRGDGTPPVVPPIPTPEKALIVAAWKGEADQLWVAHSGTDPTTGSRWEPVDVAALAGLNTPDHPSLTMDEDLNMYLVFSARYGGRRRVLYLSVRNPGGSWTTPTQINDAGDYSSGSTSESYYAGDFPVLAISSSADPNGMTVLICWSVEYREADSGIKEIRGKAFRRGDLESAGWDFSALGTPPTEVDIGGSTECRDPSSVASRLGTFLVFYVYPSSRANTQVRYTSDPVDSTLWSGQIEVCPDTADTQGVQNFPTAALDDMSGSCIVTWEDSAAVRGVEQTPYGAVCSVDDPAAWTPLGNLTDLPIASSGQEGSYPCVIAWRGATAVFYITPDYPASNAIMASRRGVFT